MCCSDCYWYIPKTPKWGRCPLARTDMFIHKPGWCKEGYKARHSNARYNRNPACKTRFKPKEVDTRPMQNDEYYDAYISEWNKMLKGQNKVTEQEKKELHELMEKQKAQKGRDYDT